MGAPCPGRPKFRKVNEGPYKIFYRAFPQKIVIFRIWDGRRSSDPKV